MEEKRSIPLTDQEWEAVLYTLGRSKLPPESLGVSVAGLMKKISIELETPYKHPFEEPRVMPWLKEKWKP